MGSIATETELGHALRDLLERLQAGIHVEALVLYGSYVRGSPDEWSDFDVAVVSPDFEGMSLPARQRTLSRLTHGRDRRVAPLGFPSSEYHNPGPHSFLGEIIRTGRVVFGEEVRTWV